MTELVLGLAWPVVVAVVAGMAFVGWRLGGQAVKERDVTDEALERLGREVAEMASRTENVLKRIKTLEDSQQHHATLLGKQQKGGQL